MRKLKLFIKKHFDLDPRKMRKLRKIFSPFKRIGLKKKFTIFSDNCWGGRVYDKFGLQYLSPTIRLYMNNYDFLRFVNNFDELLDVELMIKNDVQKQVNDEWGYYDCSLGDITIGFRHYRNAIDGINKWNRRKQRIVRSNIIVKMSYYVKENEQIDDVLISMFAALPYKKILLTNCEDLVERKELGKVIFFNNDDDQEFIHSDDNLKLKDLKKIIND